MSILIYFLSFSVSAEQVRIGVASNFLPTAKEIAKQFEQVHGERVILSSGSSGKLYAQIAQGAPFNVFLSADSARPQKLVEQGIGQPESLFTYAVGQLALLGRQDSSSLPIEQQLLQNNVRFVAIANPDIAPYGLAAKEVLQNLSLWTSIQAKLVRGENVSQTLQFVLSGNAQLGLVSYSQAVLMSEYSKHFQLIPQSLYNPIEQQAVVIRQNKSVAAYIRFLKSSQSREIIQRHGYGLP